MHPHAQPTVMNSDGGAAYFASSSARGLSGVYSQIPPPIRLSAAEQQDASASIVCLVVSPYGLTSAQT